MKQPSANNARLESLLRQGAPTQLREPTHPLRPRVMSRIASATPKHSPRFHLPIAARPSLAIAASLALLTITVIFLQSPAPIPAPTPNAEPFSLMSLIDTIPQPSQLRIAASQAMLQPYQAERDALLRDANVYAQAFTNSLRPFARVLTVSNTRSAPSF